MLRKLEGGRGETLVETLVSLLITSLALMMLAGIVAATVRVTETGDELINEINTYNRRLEQRPAEPSPVTGTVTIKDASGAKLTEDKTVTFYIADYGDEKVISYAP